MRFGEAPKRAEQGGFIIIIKMPPSDPSGPLSITPHAGGSELSWRRPSSIRLTQSATHVARGTSHVQAGERACSGNFSPGSSSSSSDELDRRPRPSWIPAVVDPGPIASHSLESVLTIHTSDRAIIAGAMHVARACRLTIICVLHEERSGGSDWPGSRPSSFSGLAFSIAHPECQKMREAVDRRPLASSD